MRSVEEHHQSQVSRLEMEISRLKDQNKNAAADKAKALEQAKAQFEKEKERMREQFDRDTALLRETIAKLEADIADMEEKFAVERNNLLSNLRAAKERGAT